MDQNRRLLPLILTFWLSLTLLFIFFKSHHSLNFASGYVIFLGQFLFDLTATYMFWELGMRLTGARKRVAVLFFIGLLGLSLSDFFYHGMNTVSWFQMGIDSADLFYELPLLAFFFFSLLGFIKISSVYKDGNERDVLFYGMIILAAIIAGMLFFLPADQTFAQDAQVDKLLTLKTIIQILCAVFGVLAMGRVDKGAFNYFAIGIFCIFIADFMMNVHAGPLAINARGLELVWMLGSILLATGGYLRLQAND